MNSSFTVFFSGIQLVLSFPKLRKGDLSADTLTCLRCCMCVGMFCNSLTRAEVSNPHHNKVGSIKVTLVVITKLRCSKSIKHNFAQGLFRALGKGGKLP